MKKAFIIFTSLMVCLILLFGCGPAEETTTTTTKPPTSTTLTTTHTTTTTTTTTATVARSVLQCPQGDPDLKLTPQYGGTLRLLYPATPTNLGAIWLNSTPHDGACSRPAIENLVGLDAAGTPVPQLASSWVSDPAKMTITFTLREGVNFHDGTPFNAEAVKWCLEKYKAGDKTDLKPVTAIDVIDATHLRLTLSSWDPLFVQNLNGSGAGKMVSPTAAQKLGDDIARNPVGTGPFKLVSFTPNVSVKYTKWEGYWQKGLPYLNGIEINIVDDAMVALTSFKKGEAHALRQISTADAQELQSEGYIITAQTATILSVCGDSKNADSPFANIDVRRAIAYAIDAKTIVASVYDNMSPYTNQLALPGFQGYNSSIQGYPYDVAKAKALLEPLGITPATPLNTKLVYASDPQRADLYLMVQNYLAKVGINITLESLNYGAYSAYNRAGWNNHLLQYGLSYNGIEMQYSNTVRNNLSNSGSGFRSVYTPPEFNDLLAVTMAENDFAKREIYYQQLNKMAVDEYCLVIPLLGMQVYTVKVPQLHDCGFGDKVASEYLPERIWVEQ